MEFPILERIGLTRNQAAVYLSLLRLDFATAQQIVHETGMHRSRVYESLEMLEQIGIANHIVKDFRRYFQAADPEKLFSILDEKKYELKSSIHALKAIRGMKKNELSGSVYKGKESLKTIHREMLREGKNIYVLGGKGFIFSELKYFMPQFEKERLKKGMKWKVLWDTEEAKKKSARKLMQGKVLPKGAASQAVINIFGKNVAIILWNEKHPSAFVIQDKEVSDAFKKWFEIIWKTVKN